MKKVYLLPGRRGKLSDIGENILKYDYEVYGRETRGEFEVTPLSRQIEVIANDIKKYFWSKDAKLIGRSYGGYLMMHTLMEFLPEIFPGKVLLFSPVLGRASGVAGYGSRPPRADKILNYAKEGKLEGLNIEIHTGDKDIGCDYKLAQEIFSYIKSSEIHIIKDAPHLLSPIYIDKVLKKFLLNEKD